MVKRQKEKQYESAREHRTNSQLRSNRSTSSSLSSSVQRLPFHCCALSLTPFTDPVCSAETGIIFDSSSIVPYLQQHKSDPVTGKAMTTRDLITLHMDRSKDDEGETSKWQCPVLEKAFTDRTPIVAIRRSSHRNEAYVYSLEAVEELNYKSKNYLDLTTGEPFDKHKDVIVLQNPADETHEQLRDIQQFRHLHKLRAESQQKQQKGENVRYSLTASRIMDKLSQQQKQKQKADKHGEAENKSFPGSTTTTTTSSSGGSLTSTIGFTHPTDSSSSSLQKDHKATDETQRNRIFDQLRGSKKKGLARLHTTLGIIDIELHCDLVPRTCANFLGLAALGEYNNTLFHRSIPKFMIQGGKPTTTKTTKEHNKERCLWAIDGDPSTYCIPDEYHESLIHEGRGIVSMANSGTPDTNRRQFFITFGSCRHLDRKHSVFGRVVVLLQNKNNHKTTKATKKESDHPVLKAMESIPTTNDSPITEIKLNSIEVLVDPVTSTRQWLEERDASKLEQEQLDRQSRRAEALGQTNVVSLSKKKKGREDTNKESTKQKQDKTTTSSSSSSSPGGSSGIGKYLPKTILDVIEKEEDNHDYGSNKKRKRKKQETAESLLSMTMTTPTRLPKPPKTTTFGNFSSW